MRASVVAIALAGCVGTTPRPTAKDNPGEIVDSSGAVFGWVCDAAGCVVVPVDGTPPTPTCPSGQVAGYGFVVDRFFSMTVSCDNVTYLNWQRPLACSSDADCPQLYQFSSVYRFECRSGLCQNADVEQFPPQTVIEEDAFRLCYGPFAREETIEPGSPHGLEVTSWVESACPQGLADPCSLPLPGECLNP